MKTLRIEKPCNVHFQCLRMFLWSVKKPWKERASQKGHKCAWGHLRPPATVKPWNDYSWINEPKQDQQTGPAKPSPNYRTLVIILTSRNDYKKIHRCTTIVWHWNNILHSRKIQDTLHIWFRLFHFKDKENCSRIQAERVNQGAMSVKMVEEGTLKAH